MTVHLDPRLKASGAQSSGQDHNETTDWLAISWIALSERRRRTCSLHPFGSRSACQGAWHRIRNVTFPTLADAALRTEFESARKKFYKSVLVTGKPAARYAPSK